MASIGELLKKPSFLMKILELILAVVGVALHQDSVYNQIGTPDIYSYFTVFGKNKTALVYMVYCGFVLITLVNIIGKVIDGITKKMDLLWNVIGCILWLAAGGVILKAYTDFDSLIPSDAALPKQLQRTMNEELGAGIIGILSGLAHLVEFLLVSKFENEN